SAVRWRSSWRRTWPSDPHGDRWLGLSRMARRRFLPAGFAQKRELEWASRQLSAIEINATYHRLQKPQSFRSWREQTPDGFVFAVKGSSYVTNRKVLAEAGPSLERFFAQGLDELGDRLGPILWQLMGTKRFDADDIAAFFALLPRELSGRPLR